MLRKVVAVALGVSMLALAGCAAQKRLQEENDRLGIELRDAHKEHAALLKNIEALEVNAGDLQQKLKAAQSESSSMAALVEELVAEQARLTAEREDLEKILQNLEGIGVETRGEGNVIVVENEILFKPGKTELAEDAMASLDKVAEYLAGKPDVAIRVDGHTDGVPIKVSGWKDNYHLAAMRAHAVMEYLVQKGLAPTRAYITGFGPNRPRKEPAAPQEPTAENRRVEILLVPRGGRSVGEILKGFEK